MKFGEFYLTEEISKNVKEGIEKFNIPVHNIFGKQYISLYHGTSNQNHKKILSSGKLKVNTYLTPDLDIARRFAGMTGNSPIVDTATIDTDAITFDGNYFYTIKEVNFRNGVYS